MEKQKMSVTRALSELKLLDSRIRKEVGGSTFIDVYQERKNQTIIEGVTKEKFNTDAKAKYDSIVDLIARRKNIKAAIMESNAKTKIKVGGKTYTVAESIDRKDSIQYDRLLYTRMLENYTDVRTKEDTQNKKLDEDIQRMVSENLGGDKKVDEKTYSNVADPFFKNNSFNQIDPIGVKDKLEKMEKEIDIFINEIDFALSESNSKTDIEV